jgi:hypothetical protein
VQHESNFGNPTPLHLAPTSLRRRWLGADYSSCFSFTPTCTTLNPSYLRLEPGLNFEIVLTGSNEALVLLRFVKILPLLSRPTLSIFS